MKKIMLAFVFLMLLWVLAFWYFSHDKKPMATCNDGTVSYSKHRSGTCSRHGGVYQWAKDSK